MVTDVSKMFGWSKMPYLPITPVFSVYPSLSGNLRYSLSTCSKKSIYGLHRASLIREFFNTSTNTTVLVEVKHLHEYFVVPDAPYSKNNNSSFVVPVARNLGANGVSTNDIIVFVLRTVLEGVIFIIVCMLIIIAGFYIYRTYKNKIFLPLRKYILDTKAKRIMNTKRFDVAILCCEQDRGIWMDGILDSLERTYKATVFFSHRDFEHLGGNSEYDLYLRMYQETECFILHVTKSFLDDNTCLQLQLEFLLVHIKEKQTSSRKVMIIHDNFCELPPKVLYSLPSATMHNWAVTTEVGQRIKGIVDWLLVAKQQHVSEIEDDVGRNGHVYTMLL